MFALGDTAVQIATPGVPVETSGAYSLMPFWMSGDHTKPIDYYRWQYATGITPVLGTNGVPNPVPPPEGSFTTPDTARAALARQRQTVLATSALVAAAARPAPPAPLSPPLSQLLSQRPLEWNPAAYPTLNVTAPPLDEPIYRRPLFWAGAAAVVASVYLLTRRRR